MAGFVDNIASSLGLQPSLVTALLALFASVPASHVFYFIKSPQIRHAYSIVAGSALCWFAYGGWDALLRLWGICFYTYLCMSILPRRWSGNFNAVTCFLILIALHIQNYQSDKWREGGMDYTGTLMVFVLKLVSVGLDYQDGGLPADKASHVKYRNKLPHFPSFLPFMSFMFFPASLMYGPVSVYNDFTNFIEHKGVWSNEKEHSNKQSAANKTSSESDTAPPPPSGPPYPLPVALLAFLTGVAWLGITFFARQYFPGTFLTDSRYFQISLPMRLGFLFCAALSTRGQFYFAWSIADSAMIASGFGFNGWTAGNGGRMKADWSHLRHCSPYMVELGTSMTQVVGYWNMSVSAWLRTYVYDRLTPPNGKPSAITLILTQAVSAFWHGWQPGYYLCFVNAAVAQHATKMIYRFMSAQGKAASRSHDILQRVLKHFLLSYSVVGFLLLTFKDTIAVWRSLYFYGTVLPLVVIFLLPMVKLDRKQAKVQKVE